MSAPVTTTPPPDRLRLILAFAAVYIIWGSTYLAVALVTERLPPLFTSAVRFLLAGTLMYAYARAKGIAPPTFRNWGAALLVGTLLLGVGNGTLAIAIQHIPTGVVALLIASLPLWIVLLNWMAFARKRPGPRETAGVVLGLVGMTILIGPDRLQAGDGLNWLGVTILVLGTISWAIGTLAAPRTPLPTSQTMATAMQILAAGVVLVPAGLLLEDWSVLAGHRWTFTETGAMAYLVIFGSIVAFTCYAWLVQVAPP
ncbi:MAG: EamA family transporter, partial [Cytophagales bacterium]|nr:EamA family transporter [Cytophagales bacterium]